MCRISGGASAPPKYLLVYGLTTAHDMYVKVTGVHVDNCMVIVHVLAHCYQHVASAMHSSFNVQTMVLALMGTLVLSSELVWRHVLVRRKCIYSGAYTF